MKTIHKSNKDFVFLIDIETLNDTHRRVHDFNDFSIKIYTNDIDEYIECWYVSGGTGTYHNIIPQTDEKGREHDFCVVNASELETLEDGVMKLHIEYKLKSDYHDDNYYNDCYDIETDYVLVTKRYDHSSCQKNCLIDD